MARIAILIGNQTFHPDSGLAPLAGPRNDVEALAAVLSDSSRGNFEVAKFIDKNNYEITPQLEQALAEARNGDTIFIYYAGHGKMDRNGRLCLATANTSKLLYSTSITAAHLADLVSQSRCECVILVLDCCYSGAFGKTITRGDTESQFAIVSQSSGLHVFTATTAIQTASELEEDVDGIAMGKFTHAIVDGIRTGAADRNNSLRISLSDLRTFVQDAVTGQDAQYWARGAGGTDPIISLVRPPDALMVQRRARLDRWREGLRIEPKLYRWLVRVLDGEGSVELVATVRGLLDDPDSTPERIADALEGIPGLPGASVKQPLPLRDAQITDVTLTALGPKGLGDRPVHSKNSSRSGRSLRRWPLVLFLTAAVLAASWVANWAIGDGSRDHERAVTSPDSMNKSTADVVQPFGYVNRASAQPQVSAATPLVADTGKSESDCSTLDEDTDGISNCVDKCPESRFGQDIGTDGCPTAVLLDLKGTNFDSGKDELRRDAKAILDEAVLILKSYEDLHIEVAGHTDSEGTDEFNQYLSQRRAQVVYDYLVSMGINRSRLIAIGYGETRPIAPNTNQDGSDDPDGRARNNRVDLNFTH